MKIRAAVLDKMEIPHPYAHSRPIAIENVNLGEPGPGELHRLTLDDLNEGFDRLAAGEAIRQVILV